MKKRSYFWKENTGSTRKKYSIVNLLEIILIKKIMMYFMKLVECKPLLVSLKIKHEKN